MELDNYREKFQASMRHFYVLISFLLYRSLIQHD